MLHYLESLEHLALRGAVLEKNEVIKRYRLQKNFNPDILRLLCMTDFFMLGRNEKGEITIV